MRLRGEGNGSERGEGDGTENTWVNYHLICSCRKFDFFKNA